MNITVGDFPDPPQITTYPTHIYTYSASTPVAVLATLTEQDKEALKAMLREVVTEVVNEALDERERNADEARRREYMEI